MALTWLHKFQREHKIGMKNEFPYTEARVVDSPTQPVVTYWVWHVQKNRKVRKRVILTGATHEAKMRDGEIIRKQINKLLIAGWHVDEKNVATSDQLDDALDPKPVETANLDPDNIDKRISLSDARIYYRTAKGKDLRNDTTLPLYEGYLDHLVTWLDSRKKTTWRLRDITRSLANQFLDQAPQGGRYRNNMLGFLQGFWTFFGDRGGITINPWERIRKVRVDESDAHRPYTPDQAVALRAAMLDAKQEQLWLFCQFIYFLFLRPGKELRFLKVGDILTDKVRVASETSKNRKIGHLDIPIALEAEITRLGIRNFPPGHYVFSILGRPGQKPVHENYFYKRHRKILETLKMIDADYDLYSWKPTGAIVLYRSTLDILRVQRHCRHSTPDQTFTYLRKHGIIAADAKPTDLPPIW